MRPLRGLPETRVERGLWRDSGGALLAPGGHLPTILELGEGPGSGHETQDVQREGQSGAEASQAPGTSPTLPQPAPSRARTHFSLSCTGEGNGNPLQCSCLENPRASSPLLSPSPPVLHLSQLQGLSNESALRIRRQVLNRWTTGEVPNCEF